MTIVDPVMRELAAGNIADMFRALGSLQKDTPPAGTDPVMIEIVEQADWAEDMSWEMADLFLEHPDDLAEMVLATLEANRFIVMKGTT